MKYPRSRTRPGPRPISRTKNRLLRKRTRPRRKLGPRVKNRPRRRLRTKPKTRPRIRI